MPNTKDLVVGDKLKVLVFGRSGTGKTFGAATWPRPVFIDFDHGIMTVRGLDFVSKYGNLGIEYYQPTERQVLKSGIVQQHTAFDDATLYFESMMKPDKVDTFDTWVVDTGTSLSDAAMNKAIAVLGLKKLSTTFENAKTLGVLMPQRNDWGSERSLVEQFIAMVKNTDKHFVMLCHEKEITDEKGNTLSVKPLLTGRGVEAVSAMFDEVYRLQLKRDGVGWKRTLQTVTDGTVTPKTRIGIKDGTPWEWSALEPQLKAIRAAQAAAKPAA